MVEPTLVVCVTASLTRRVERNRRGGWPSWCLYKEIKEKLVGVPDTPTPVLPSTFSIAVVSRLEGVVVVVGCQSFCRWQWGNLSQKLVYE